MPQVGHIDVRDAPIDLTAGRGAGSYIAQVVSPFHRLYVGYDRAVLYATATVAPADAADWFHAGGGGFFTFAKGEGVPPTWVMLAPEYLAELHPSETDPHATLAIASYDA